jgi:predicted nucleotidyltransferase
MNSNQIILSDLKKHLSKNFDKPIQDVILFGSQAVGYSKEGSGFDVLVVLNSDYDWKDEGKVLDLCFDINLKYDIIIDLHLLSKSEIVSPRGKQPVFVNALKKGLYA